MIEISESKFGAARFTIQGESDDKVEQICLAFCMSALTGVLFRAVQEPKADTRPSDDL